MNFIRPEAQAALWRWRELIAAGMMLALGLKWALWGLGFWAAAGWALTAIGVIAAVIGGQRLRFRLGQGGPGVVQVDEGQITYFGPLTGGSVAVRELARVGIDHGARPAHWVLEQPGEPALFIPVNAGGADDLFDAFSALPGLKVEKMLAELRSAGTHQAVIWEKHQSTPPVHRLH